MPCKPEEEFTLCDYSEMTVWRILRNTICMLMLLFLTSMLHKSLMRSLQHQFYLLIQQWPWNLFKNVFIHLVQSVIIFWTLKELLMFGMKSTFSVWWMMQRSKIYFSVLLACFILLPIEFLPSKCFLKFITVFFFFPSDSSASLSAVKYLVNYSWTWKNKRHVNPKWPTCQ